MTEIIQRKLFLPGLDTRATTVAEANACESITDIMSMLKPYMLTINNKSILQKESIETHVSICDNVQESLHVVEKPCDNKISNLTPGQADSLFWCIYIAIHKYEEYLMIHNKHNMLELEWKQKLSKQITDCPSKLKQSTHKVTKANIQEILSDFMTAPYKTNMLCVIAITVYYNIHIIIMNSTNNMRMEFLTDTHLAETYVIYKNEKNHYSICPEPASADELARIRSSSFLIENNEKPLKSIGSYKVDELIQYAKLFGIYNDHEKYKKNELHEIVGEYAAKYNITI
jgi:hypothetical protein